MVENREREILNEPARGFAEALAEADIPTAADRFAAWLQESFAPEMKIGFTVDRSGAVRIRRVYGTPPAEFSDPFDFAWVEPILGADGDSGDTVSVPDPDDPDRLIAMAAAMRRDSDFGYVVLLGSFRSEAEGELGTIARDASITIAAVERAVPRMADQIQQAERDRLSRDLHDSLSQSLWSLSMLSETAHGMVEPSDPLHEMTAKIAEISLSAQEQMRGLLSSLRTAEPARGSAVLAIEDAAAAFRAQTSLEVVVSAQNVELEPDQVMALRRITEEALNNAGRHSYASSVLVQLDDDPVTLRIADNGVGFRNAHAPGHLGVRIMKERAEELGFELETGTSALGGAEILVSDELDRAVPLFYEPVRRKPPSLRRAGWALAGCVALIVALFGSLAARSTVEQDARLAAEELDILVVTQSHVALARAAEDELLASILIPVGLASEADVERAAAARQVTIVDARTAVEPLLDSSTRAGVRAAQVVEVINAAQDLPSGSRRIGALLGEVETLELMMGSLNSAATPVDAVANLAVIEISLGLALFETVVAHQIGEGEPVPTFDGVFSALSRFDVGAFEGAFGPYESAPLLGGVAPDTAAAAYEPESLVALNDLVAASSLWATDRWVRSAAPNAEQPPVPLDTYVQDWTEVATAARELVDERFDALAGELAQERDSSNRRATWFAAASLISGLLALACVVHVARAFTRRVRFELYEQRLDPLTGAGNRGMLGDTLLGHLASTEFDHHLVATIDMDQFKLVNDGHGHAFGDRVLRVVALGLHQIAARESGVVGEVVRLGGDEFLLSLHSGTVIDEPTVRRRLEQLRQTLLSAPDGTMVRCAFSFGIVSASGSPDLASLMAASDLSAYEDKAHRTRSSRNFSRASATSTGN